jgi:dienelactone hydrolase
MNNISKLLLSILAVAVIIFSISLLYYKKEGINHLYQEIVIKRKAFSFVFSSSEVEFMSNGLTLRGSLYMPDGSSRFPGIVLAHGGTRLGRKLSLYRILSYKLAQRGYVVLSFDFRGFGESEDPVRFETAEDLDFVGDAKQAVSFLLSVKGVDTSKIFLVGHSFGAGVVIPTGIHDTRVAKIVSIAPGRRGNELFWSENAPAKHYPRQRLAQDMEIPQIQRFPIDVLNPLLQDVTIDTVLKYPLHQPILLIDGEMEDQEDLLFLRNLYTKMTEPKTYITIQNANHYFGTLRDDRGFYNLVTYWDNIVEDLVETIDFWLKKEHFIK